MKFICKNCKESDPCILEIGNHFSITGENLTCIYRNLKDAKWERFKEVTGCNQLPKLTAEVFDRPDCPEWANWAAVDSNGDAYYYKSEPSADRYRWRTGELDAHFIPVCFDASDWQNSLIERPAKALPDWCKVGEWVYFRNAFKMQSEYLKIAKIKGHIVISEKEEQYFFTTLSPARLRPYNAEEMRGLVGKVVKKGQHHYLVTAYFEEEQSIIIASLSSALFDAELLIVNNITIDGSPCGVLEHLENGEWVK